MLNEKNFQMTVVMHHLGKSEAFSSFLRSFLPPYATFGRTAPRASLSTKILLAAFFRFMQILFSMTWALTFTVPK